MKKLIILFGFIFFQICCFSQKSSNIIRRFHDADSIVLAKHLSTNSPVIIDDRTGKKLPQRKLLHGNKLNKAIILKAEKLSPIQKQSLLNILTENLPKVPQQTMQCFMPRNAILIYRKLKISYLDLCFECFGFETTSDINLGEDYLSPLKWAKLNTFFAGLNLISNKEELLK